MSGDEPAYEFPTGDDTARVVVRKHRTQPLWLITAWAADGADRTVPIYVPELGQLTVEARIVGSVYKATLDKGKVTLIRQDDEGATYSAVAPGTPVVTPVNLTIPLPANDRLLWLVADKGVTADAAGKVSAWASQSGGVKVIQPDAARRPTLVAKAVSGKPAIRFANSFLANLDLGAQGDAFIGPLTVYAVFTDANSAARGTVVMAMVPNGNPWAADQGFAIANNIAENTQVTQGVLLKTAPGPSVAKRLQKLMIGENDQPGSGFGFTGDVAELLVYKGLSALNQERVRLYLENKYGISRHTTLVNGDFEEPVAKGGFQYAPCPGTTHSRGAQGWFFASLAALQANGSGWSDATAPSGKQTSVLQGSAGRLGSISQMVHLAAGTYTMSCKAARGKGQIQPLKFTVDQIQIGSLLTPAGATFQPLTTARFTVTDGLHLVRLEATDGTGDKSTLLDEVILQPVNAAKSP